MLFGGDRCATCVFGGQSVNLPLCHGSWGWIAIFLVELGYDSLQVVLLVESVAAIGLAVNLESQADASHLLLDAVPLLKSFSEPSEILGATGDEEIVDVECEDVANLVNESDVDAEVDGRAFESELEDVRVDGSVPDVVSLLEAVEALD